MFEQDEQELRAGQLRIIIVIMVVLLVALLSYTIIWSTNYNKTYGFFKKTIAEVVEQSESDGVVKDVLLYEVDGVEYRLTGDYNSKNEIGDKVKIYYDKNNPLGVVYKLDSNRVLLPVLTSLFGVGCIILMVVYILIIKDISDKKKLIEYLQSTQNQQTKIDNELLSSKPTKKSSQKKDI